MGEGNEQALRATFDRRFNPKFQGSKVMSDAGLTPAGRKSEEGDVLRGRRSVCAPPTIAVERERGQEPCPPESKIQSRSRQRESGD
jgi:hypothetical protein